MQIPRFIKWAGGKQQLIEQYRPLFPKKFKGYFESFVGSGAVAFHIIQQYRPRKVFLSDANEELINAYLVIQQHQKELIQKLKELKAKYAQEPKKQYYWIRGLKPSQLSAVDSAARFIFLNRTCYNGLYRVNSKGQFNVPMGHYKNPDIVHEKKILQISKVIKKVHFMAMDFEKVVKLARKDDFVYFDPPYYPLKKGRNFTSYQKNAFLENEQKRLANAFQKLHEKGAKVMLSNSDTEFIKGLYFGFKLHTVQAKRMISCNAETRGAISEIVVTNY